MQAITTEADLTAQRASAGLMMSYRPAIELAIRECISPSWFSDLACEAVATVCFELYGNNAPIDLITVTTAISKARKLDAIGGAGTVSGLEVDAGNPGTENYWFKELRTGWKRREAIRLLSKLQGDIIEGRCEAVDGALVALSQIASMDRRLAARKPWKDYILEAIDAAEAALGGSAQSEGVRIGLRAFDDQTGGIAPGLVVVAAETSGGKSLFMVQAALAIAKATQKPALIVSLEMSGRQIAQRGLAAAGTVPLSFLTRGVPPITQSQFERFFGAAQTLSQIPIILEYCPGATAGQIRSMALDAAGSTGLSCVVVDYVQLMGFDGRFDNREQAVSESARRLKVMQGELECPVLIGSQLNDDGRLRESRAIGMHADEVYSIEHGPIDSKIVFTKRRQDAKGTSVPVRMVGQYARFEDVT